MTYRQNVSIAYSKIIISMTAILYFPHQLPRVVPIGELSLPDTASGFVKVPSSVAVLLDCAPTLVDVLASGPGYVAYSVFDCEGEINHTAMVAVSEVSGVKFDESDEDSVLRGGVLVVHAT